MIVWMDHMYDPLPVTDREPDRQWHRHEHEGRHFQILVTHDAGFWVKRVDELVGDPSNPVAIKTIHGLVRMTGETVALALKAAHAEIAKAAKRE